MSDGLKSEKVDPTITFAWNPPDGEARMLQLTEEGFFVDGELTTDLDRVFAAVQDFDRHITAQEPELLTAKFEKPDETFIGWTIEEDEMMLFRGDGSIYLQGKFIVKDPGLAARIYTWIEKNRVHS